MEWGRKTLLPSFPACSKLRYDLVCLRERDQPCKVYPLYSVWRLLASNDDVDDGFTVAKWYWTTAATLETHMHTHWALQSRWEKRSYKISASRPTRGNYVIFRPRLCAQPLLYPLVGGMYESRPIRVAVLRRLLVGPSKRYRKSDCSWNLTPSTSTVRHSSPLNLLPLQTGGILKRNENVAKLICLCTNSFPVSSQTRANIECSWSRNGNREAKISGTPTYT